jgi:hypothetical protein
VSRGLVGLVLAVAFVATLVVVTMRETRVRCEVCVSFRARTACRNVSAVDREQALLGARSAACAVLSNGVTEGIQCQRTVPVSASCDEK